MALRPLLTSDRLRKVAGGFAVFLLATVFTLWLTAIADQRHWFAHSSEQWTAIMNVAVAILASPWLHWIGGAIIGFTAGVWVDYVLRIHVTKTPLKPLPKREKGFIDYSFDIVNSQEAANRILVSVGKRTTWLGNQFPRLTRRLEQLMRSYGPTTERPIPSRKFIVKAQRIAADTAKKYDRYSSEIERKTEEYKRHVTTVITATTRLNDLRPEGGTAQEIEAIRLMRGLTETAKGSITSFIASIRSQRGVSAEMADAIDRAVAQLERLVESIGLLETFCIDYLVNNGQKGGTGAITSASTPSPPPPQDTGPGTSC